MLCFDEALYPKTAVLKAAYHFTDRAYVYIQHEGTNFLVELKPKDCKDEILDDKFKNELLAQVVRYEIFLQTKEIREFIVGRAMASTILEDNTEESEPAAGDTDLSDILTDWFEKNE
jgi:His-Xaa-Ser system protein HxsD